MVLRYIPCAVLCNKTCRNLFTELRIDYNILVSFCCVIQCSIDALLDRTIKHMLFLQCVPSQAEKLRHSAQPKVFTLS